MQPLRGLTHPAGLQGQRNALALDVRRVAGAGILPEQRPAPLT